MKRIIRWFVHNPVSANLMMAFLIGYGLIQLAGIKKEVFPEYTLDMIQVQVPYRGATPSDVEESICNRIEEEISGIDGIKKINATAVEGMGTVTVEIQKGYDSRKLLDDIKSAVDRITNFPRDIEKPVISELSRKSEVLKVILFGNASEKDLKRIGEKMRDDISALPGISLITLAAVRPYEISIEIPEHILEKYNLTLPSVAAIVAENCRDIPAGKIKQQGEEILVRTKGLKYTSRDFYYIPITRDPAGTPVFLGDIASIVDGFEETDASSRFDGRNAVVLKVYRIGDQSALDVEKKVKAYLETERHLLPAGIQATITTNMADILRQRLNLLIKNAKWGLLLVILLLAMFLELRLALWVSFGIPLSFFGAFILLPHFGVSVNMISLFAFIICLGIVVDDAIIVGEHIFTKVEAGMDRFEAAIEGASEMAVPVIFTVLTTIAAFMPLLTVSGVFGKFMFAIPAVVISVLTISLLESLFILPAHLAHLKNRKESRILQFLPNYFDRQLDNFIEKVYQPALQTAIEWKSATIAIGIAMLLITIGFVAGGRIKILFFPKVDADQVVARIQMPEGASADQTRQVAEHLAATAETVREKIRQQYGRDIIRHIVVNVASMPYSARHVSTVPSGPDVGEVAMELVKGDARKGINSNDIANLWREVTGEIAGAKSISFTASLFSAGAAIDVQLSSDSFADLKAAARRLKMELQNYNGVKDITDNIQGGKPEIKLHLTPRGKALGLSVTDLGLQVRGAFYGTEAVRIQRQKDDVRVMVRYPLSERRSFANLETMKIVTPSGTRIPLSQVATWTVEPGYSVITRTNRRRVVDVKADVDNTIADAKTILSDLQANFLEPLKVDYPGLNYSFEGEEKERRDSMASMLTGFLVALFLIFVLLAVPFNSFKQPVIIMSAIPFGIIGAIFGHVLLGYNLSMLSFFGIVALAGVLVNDSLVLMDAINKKMAHHPGDVTAAVIAAAKSRFRPVMLTSLTTFGGLVPMILETSLQARFLIPMAISLGFGVLFATGITLILVPSLYMVTTHFDT